MPRWISIILPSSCNKLLNKFFPSIHIWSGDIHWWWKWGGGEHSPPQIYRLGSQGAHSKLIIIVILCMIEFHKWCAHEFNSICKTNEASCLSQHHDLLQNAVGIYYYHSGKSVVFGFLVKREELMIVMKVEHFYDSIFMHIHENKANNTELTDITKELIGRYERKHLRNKFD